MAELSITRSPINSPPKGGKASAWSITINNPTDADIESWKHAKMLHWVKDVKGQLEKGENGTPHIQGMLVTESVRFSQVKKAFPRAHIEAAKNKQALATYVQKDETRVATITPVKVGTATDVQNECLGQVQNWLEEHRPGKDLWDCKSEIETHWELFLDKAVNELIQKGYYGMEFAVCNPQVRSAYRRYFWSICIRQYEENLRQEASRQTQASIEAQADDAPPPSSDCD